MQKTLSIIKPDAVKKGIIGQILSRFESNGLKIVAIKKMHLSKEQAERFYAVHNGKVFYNNLINYMISGSIVVLVLEGVDAVKRSREIIGATDPKEAKPGTIRADFAENITVNAVHGSDSEENANNEISFFFNKLEIN